MSFGDGNLHERVAGLERENAALRSLVRDMWHDGIRERDGCATCEYGYIDRMRELGIAP